MAALLSVSIAHVSAQGTGTIKGTVTTKQDSAAIWGASIYISGTIHSSYSEEDGSFYLEEVPPGTYDISTEDFTTGDSALTRGIVVIAGDTTEVSVKIGISVKVGEVIEIVYEQPKAESVEGAIEEVKEETKVTTIVSAEEFKSKGDSKVTDAAKRASGVTVEGGKYVYVRGLSDRYSKTLLDGMEIPGLDPNRNAVQLDMFPTSFVQSLKVIKTFSPDLPGDFTGGLVDIRTKDYPDSLEVSISGGMKYNSQASFNDQFLTSPKSSTDFLGADDGMRDLPATVNRAIAADDVPGIGSTLFNDENAEKMEAIMDDLNGEMVPVRSQSFTPFSLGATIGNTYKFNAKGDSLGLKDQKKLGYVVGLNYRKSQSFFDNGTANIYDLTGSLLEKEELQPNRLMTSSAASEEVLIGALAKVGFEFNQNHKIEASYLKNQSGKQVASIAEGMNVDDAFYYRSRKIGFTERSMDNISLSGDHSLGKENDIVFDWKGGFTLSSQDQPDLRFFNDNRNDQDDLDDPNAPENWEFRFQNYTGPVRFFRSMEETNRDVKANLMIPVKLKNEKEIKFKVGGSYVNKNRTFTEKRLDYQVGAEGVYNGDIAAFLADDNTGFIGENGNRNQMGAYVVNQTNEKNNYDGVSTIAAGYGMADLPLGSRMKVSVGARAENTSINVQSQKEGVETATVDTLSILPSVNWSWTLIDGKKVKSKRDTNVTHTRDMKLRASFNKTLARPNFRELAPFAVEDFVNNSLVVGNPNLVLTDVLNYDLRLEYYPRAGEQFSIATFYKDFTNPIEQITSPTAANIEFTWVNNQKGRLYGMEVELRKSLDFMGEALKNFGVSGNLTLVQSSADIDSLELITIRATDSLHAETRPLFGQSPYIVNGTLSYKNDSIGLNMNVAFNVFGERLVLVTKGGLPDIYELPRPSLDFNISKTFGDRLKLTFRAKNLFNPEYKQVFKVKTESDLYAIQADNEDFVYQSYQRGRTYSFGLSYKF